MKKNKLNLEKLKVQSFITSLPEQGVNTVKGGAPYQFTQNNCHQKDPNESRAVCLSGQICRISNSGICCPIPKDKWI